MNRGATVAVRTMPWNRTTRSPCIREHGRLAAPIRSAACVLLVASLAGCVWAPGQSMSRSSVEGENSYVKLVPITPNLLQTQQQNAAPATDSGVPTALMDYRPEAYRIGPGDTLHITVWDHPELTSPAGQQQETAANERLVRPDGTLYFPYAGVVKVAGMTIEQARQAITSGLSKFIRAPLVDVSVAGYGSQHVVLEGAFVKAGAQPVTTVPMTLGEAIGVAGGVDSKNADLSNVALTRQDQTYHLDLSPSHEGEMLARKIYLRPGDRVFVPFNFNQEVYVMGEVLHPQALRFSTSNLTLTQALGQAGGLNEVTSKGMVYVVRGLRKQNPGQRPTVYELDAKSPAAFALADGFRVQPGDVVFASAAGITRWNRFTSQLLPLTSALSATASSQYYLNNSK